MDLAAIDVGTISGSRPKDLGLMDIVLPLLARDAQRFFRLQRPTFERHYADLGTTWVVARAADLAALEARF